MLLIKEAWRKSIVFFYTLCQLRHQAGAWETELFFACFLMYTLRKQVFRTGLMISALPIGKRSTANQNLESVAVKKENSQVEQNKQ